MMWSPVHTITLTWFAWIKSTECQLSNVVRHVYRLKGALRSFWEEIHTNSEIKKKIIHNWINKLFSEENKVPRTLFEARKLAESATYKQSKTAWNCVVLWVQFLYSVSEDLSLLVKISSPKLRSAPLKLRRLPSCLVVSEEVSGQRFNTDGILSACFFPPHKITRVLTTNHSDYCQKKVCHYLFHFHRKRSC